MTGEKLDQLLQQNLSPQDASNKFLTFFAQSKLYGISISNVNGITQIQQITDMPELPHYIKGVINLRGVVIPLVDVNLRLGSTQQPYTDRTCIITLEVNENHVGCIVDAVDAVIDIPEEAISPPPPLTDSMAGYITGIGKCGEEGKKIVLLLDCRALVGEISLAQARA